jgi:hypothetical protein
MSLSLSVADNSLSVEVKVNLMPPQLNIILYFQSILWVWYNQNSFVNSYLISDK